MLKRKGNRKEYRDWRLSVLERDGFTCRRCKSTDNIQAHHIKPYHLYQDEQLNIDNGVALCIDCHEEATHLLKQMYKKNNRYSAVKEEVIINEDYTDNEYIKELDRSIE